MLTRRRWVAIGLLMVTGSVGYQRHNEKEAETHPAQARFAAALDKYDPATVTAELGSGDALSSGTH